MSTTARACTATSSRATALARSSSVWRPCRSRSGGACRRSSRNARPSSSPGAAILVAILDAYGLESIRVSERDLLDGAALAAAELPEPEEGAAPPGAYTCC